MLGWRARHDMNPPRTLTAGHSAVDELLEALSASIGPILAAVEFSASTADPTHLVGDVLDVSGWNPGGDGALIEAPKPWRSSSITF